MRFASSAFVALMAVAVVLLGMPAHAQGTQPPPPTPTPPPTPPSEPKPNKRFYIGPELGVYFITDSKARDAFGSSIFNYGIGLGQIGQATQKGNLGVDLTIISGSNSNGRLLMIPLGASYFVALSKPSNVLPYAGVSADLIITHLESDKYGVNPKLRFGGGGSAFIGVNFAQRAYIQARYLGVSKIAGFNLSGLSVSTGYRF